MSLDDLNREQKRHLRRTGALDEKGAPTRVQRQAPAKKDRVGPAQYLREVRDEMRKVAWPKRDEVVRYSIVVVHHRDRLHGAGRRPRLPVRPAVGVVVRMSDDAERGRDEHPHRT